MKRLLSLLTFCMLLFQLSAQDIIFTTTRESLEVVISEITESEVQYKLWSNLNGATYSLELSYITHIQFSNGEVYVVKQSDTSTLSLQLSESTTTPSWVFDNAEDYPIVLKTGKEIVFQTGTPLEIVKNKIYYGGNHLRRKECKELLQLTCPNAYQTYKKAKVYENIAYAIMIPSLGFGAYAMYNMFSMLLNDDEVGMNKYTIEGVISLGFLLISTVIGMKSIKLFEQANSIFNQTCAWKQPSKTPAELSLNFSATSVGLCLNF